MVVVSEVVRKREKALVPPKNISVPKKLLPLLVRIKSNMFAICNLRQVILSFLLSDSFSYFQRDSLHEIR